MVINNGIVLQFGITAGKARNVAITYPVALTKKCTYINGHPIYSSITGSHDYDPNFTTTSLTSFQIYADPGGTVHAVNINWFCIGY